VLQRVIDRLTIAQALARCRDDGTGTARLERSLPTFAPDGGRAADPWALNFDWSALPEEYLRSPGAVEALQEALDALPSRHRAAALVDTEGVAVADVADAVGDTPATVRRRLHQVRMSARQRLTDYFEAATARH
jgi:DNA-directed RNA polymerase specialized sigma24 family protein